MPINQQVQLAFKTPWLPRAASAIIVALIAWWAFHNILPMFQQKEAVVTPMVNAAKVKTPTKVSLSKLDLFGQPEKSAATNKTNDAKPTKLNLTLRGVLSTDDPKKGIAQIQNDKKDEKHFTVDDKVFGVATLVEIYVDRVILLHKGRYETLTLPEKFLNVKHFSVENRKAKVKKIVTKYRDIFLSGRSTELIKLFGFDTAWKNGSFVGFVIKALGDKGLEMMELLGVRDGDIIVVVNGLRFSETLEAAQRLKELKTAKSVDVIIDRDGNEIPFHFDFDTPIAERIALGATPPPTSDGEYPEDYTSNGNTLGKQISENNNQIDSDESFDADSFTPNLSGNDNSEEDLGEDWDESDAAKEYIYKQQNRSIGVSAPVEYDH